MVEKKKTTAASWKAGPRMDRHEFAQNYQAIYRQLWLIAVSIVGDRTEAEDIVQEAAVVAFRKLNSFEAGTSFGAWVTRIVKFCAANHNRKTTGRRTQTADPISLDERVDDSNSDRSFNSLESLSESQSEFDDKMIRALNQLNNEARVCLLLRIVDGLSYAEISELLEIPEGTAMSHVHRSKKMLRRGALGDLLSQKEVPNE